MCQNTSCGTNHKAMPVAIGGVYKHYKGKMYRVLALSKSADDSSAWVIYECLYDNPEGYIWHRRIEDFIEVGTWIPGAPAVPRFVRVK